MSGWKRWAALGVATDRINHGGGWVMWRVYVTDPDQPDVWRQTDLFVSSDRHERPEWRYSVNIAGGDKSGGALTVTRKRLLDDAVAAAARQAVSLEKQRAQRALDAAVLAWRTAPTSRAEAANLAAAGRLAHWSQRVIGFECIDQQNGAA